MKTNAYFQSCVAHFFLEWEMFKTNLYRKTKHILYSIKFSRKSRRLWYNVEKFGRTEQTTEDNMEHAHCILDN
jgi:hypothetical protein